MMCSLLHGDFDERTSPGEDCQVPRPRVGMEVPEFRGIFVLAMVLWDSIVVLERDYHVHVAWYVPLNSQLENPTRDVVPD